MRTLRSTTRTRRSPIKKTSPPLHLWVSLTITPTTPSITASTSGTPSITPMKGIGPTRDLSWPPMSYSTDYTHVEGSAGIRTESCSCPVQLDRRVPTHAPMTPVKWRHLRNGNEREFTINMALAQINDPKYHGEVNRYRGLSNLQDTLERLMRDAQGRVMEVMKELVTIEGQLNLCKKEVGD